MARQGSTGFGNGYEEDPIFQKSHYTQDISEQMRVPKRIHATGEHYDDLEQFPFNNGGSNHWNYQDKIDMTVPDRIVVMGQDQHLGTRSAPREIVLDNSILHPDPSHVRVSTPPRVLTLSEHHFPSASDDPQYEQDEQKYELNQLSPSSDDHRLTIAKPRKTFGSDFFNQSREATPPMGLNGEQLSPSEEVLQLRRQVAKLSRRVLSVEVDNMQRQQRDKIVYCIGLAYFLMKALMWLNRN
ncbi:Transport and Golgi organization protein 11 [Pseudolycoriella hygida]|uniref:Transport and Golgi organization protein 11 n=1 Tax=Pseudolycoriella hygida TaxID=35572 RepID=A0A9Q0MPI0_9DIPT|nr:Transport and Golgi organization protein 11 [Pseudolycoriella hygida]